MRLLKKAAAVILAAAMAASLAACAAQKTEETTAATVETTAEETAESSTEAESSEGDTHIVVDHTGREVELPKEINRIVISSILPLPSVYCLFEGSAEKLVGIHPSSMAAAKNSILPQVVPDIVDVNTDFLQGGELNIEELLNLKPDVVFYNASSRNSGCWIRDSELGL